MQGQKKEAAYQLLILPLTDIVNQQYLLKLLTKKTSISSITTIIISAFSYNFLFSAYIKVMNYVLKTYNHYMHAHRICELTEHYMQAQSPWTMSNEEHTNTAVNLTWWKNSIHLVPSISLLKTKK